MRQASRRLEGGTGPSYRYHLSPCPSHRVDRGRQASSRAAGGGRQIPVRRHDADPGDEDSGWRRRRDLVDLRAHPGAEGHHRSSGETVTIGAATTHAEVADDEQLTEGAARRSGDLAGLIGDPHVRHKGTIGGSIANNDPAADYPAALLALGATIVTNKREIAADKFFTGLFETALEEGEIVTAVTLRGAGEGRLRQVPQPGVALCDDRRVRRQEQGRRARRGHRRRRRAACSARRRSRRRWPRISTPAALDGVKVPSEKPDGRHPRLAGIPRQSGRGDGQARGGRTPTAEPGAGLRPVPPRAGRPPAGAGTAAPFRCSSPGHAKFGESRSPPFTALRKVSSQIRERSGTGALPAP